MIAKRRAHRRGWPRGLYEPRPGYFVFRSPGGTTYPIGRVPLAVARNEAIAANAHIEDLKPGLVDRISGAGQTVAELLARMEVAANDNTAKSHRALDKRIRAAMGDTPVAQVTTMMCADLLEGVAAEDKARLAQALRVRLVAAFGRALSLGWTDHNPASATRAPKVTVKRARLLYDQFVAIHAEAPKVNEWLQYAMELALVTGADRSSIAALRRTDATSEHLMVKRPKTGALIAVPLSLRLNVIGWGLADLVKRRTPAVSKYLLHHTRPHGNAPAGSPVSLNAISKAFMRARRRAGIPDIGPDGKNAPTFHEIRSLAVRMYRAQGDVNTTDLMGHAEEETTDIYGNPRGAEPINVRVNSK